MKRWAIGFTVLAVLVGMGQAQGAWVWEVTQLTDNDYEDYGPEVSGSNVVWSTGFDNHSEIFLYDGTSTRQLTDNDYYDESPVISGAGVAWIRSRGGHDIMFYDGTTTTDLRAGVHPFKQGLHFSGSFLVWWEADSLEQVSVEILDPLPGISGPPGVYSDHDGNDYEIFLYDGTTTTQLTDNTYDDVNPVISGSNVAWQGRPEDREIFFYDGTSTIQLTDNIRNDDRPSISGRNVVWHGGDRDQKEIFLYDGSSITQLTDNDYSDNAPRVSGSNVVWTRNDGHDTEIFLYNGSSITQLTDNDYRDEKPRVSGSTVAWRRFDGNDWEIFQATLIPEPSTFIMSLLAGLTLVAGWWRRRAVRGTGPRT